MGIMGFLRLHTFIKLPFLKRLWACRDELAAAACAAHALLDAAAGGSDHRQPGARVRGAGRRRIFGPPCNADRADRCGARLRGETLKPVVPSFFL